MEAVKKFKFIFILMSVTMLASACSVSLSGTGSSDKSLGGVYKSGDKGETWAWKVLVPSLSGQPGNIGGVDVEDMVMDPGDNQTIYIGSTENGLIYTYNGGDSWQVASRLNYGDVKSVAIDPSNKCVIYAAVSNVLFKSTDCARFWKQAYYDNDPKILINTIAIDPGNGYNVYIGTSRGEVIKSSSQGGSWRTVGRLENKVKKIIVRPQNGQIIFAATDNNGLFRSDNGGEGWVDLKERMKDFSDSTAFRDMAINQSDGGLIYLATKYGLLKSINNGDDWRQINLITPEQGATINAVAVDPANAKEVYYVTNTTFYHTQDDGENWSTKKLPSSRAGWKLLIDPKNTSIVYMGMKLVK